MQGIGTRFFLEKFPQGGAVRRLRISGVRNTESVSASVYSRTAGHVKPVTRDPGSRFRSEENDGEADDKGKRLYTTFSCLRGRGRGRGDGL